MATLQWVIQNGNYIEVWWITKQEGLALKELYTEQNSPFITYPDFSQILIDWDRSVNTNTWTIDVYGVAVDALSQTNQKSGSSASYDLQLPYSGTKTYKIAWNFYFYGGEKIWEMISCKFYSRWNGSGSWQYITCKVTPKIFLVHRDWTTSETITYKQSQSFKWDSWFAGPFEYVDTSDTYLTAQYGDRLVLQYDIQYISWSWLPTALWTRGIWVFSWWNPTQISVR